MSAVLEIYHNKERAGKHRLSEKRLVIGRSRDCDLRIEEDLASREHAAIFSDSGSYWIEDLGSRNGTQVNGQRISVRQKLADGDRIAVGSREMTFGMDGVDEDNEGKTAASAEPSKELPPRERIRKKSWVSRWYVKLKVAEGYLKGEVFENWDGTLRIGRSQESDVPMISDEFLSLDHAEIVQAGDSYFIVDLGSDNGTFLNKRRVPPNQRERLTHGDKIRAGKGSLFLFELVDKELEGRSRKKTLAILVSAIVVCALIIALQPPDRAGERFDLARKAFQRGNLAEALTQSDMALRIDPRRSEALDLKKAIEVQIEANKIVDQAQGFALEGKLDEAMGLCREALRLVSKHAGGLQLVAVLQSIQLANKAIGAQNWPGAIQALEGEQARFKNSVVIKSRLDLAKRELQAFHNLSKAKEYLRNSEANLAEKLIQFIPKDSLYNPEALGLLNAIEMQRNKSSTLQAAIAAYRDAGNVEQALRVVEEGLTTSPNDATLIKLRNQFRRMGALSKPLDEADALADTAPLESLLAGLKVCDEVLQHEPDPLNTFNKKAQITKDRIKSWLVVISRSRAKEAEDFGRSGNRKEACRLFLLAVRADEGNEAASQKAEELRKQILRECEERYQTGYQYQGKNDALARESFVAVTNIGLPNLSSNPRELYYEKALEKLKRISAR